MSDIDAAKNWLVQVADHGCPDAWPDYARTLLAHIERLEKWRPVTGDGAEVTADMTLYRNTSKGMSTYDADDLEWCWCAGKWLMTWGGPDYDAVPVSQFYSTREAAERAAGGGA